MEIVYIASDHAGFELKEELKVFLSTLGHQVIDKGPFVLNKDDDYPELVSPVALEVAKDQNAKGIVIGGSGQAEAIVCNRFKNVRAALFYGGVVPKKSVNIEGHVSHDALEIVRLSRQHNNSNILSLGARFITAQEAKIAVNVWLGTNFSGDERHIRRIKKLDELV